MPVLNRRERQRQATNDEILQTARTLLRAGHEVSIRAVAGEMGMTPPALYRYVANLAALEDLVAESIFNDVIAAMAAARDLHEPSDPAAQIVAAAAAFRRWALDNPREFTSVFGSAPDPDARPKEGSALAPMWSSDVDPCTVGPGNRFGQFFSEIFARLWMTQPFPVPSKDELDPSFIEMHRGSDVVAAVGDDAYGMLWLFEMAWARLYGTVTLEVFAHIPAVLIESGAIFNAQMVEIGRSIGLAGDSDRLIDITRDVAQR